MATATNNEDWRTELRKSFDTAAQNQITESNREYDQAISAADRQALSRGMQRSSYNLATQANLASRKVEAQNRIRSDVDAQYAQAALQQQNVEDEKAWQREQAAQQQSNWQASFDAQQKQQEWSNTFQQNQFNYQQSRDTVADAQWQKQYDEQLRQFNEQMAYQRERAKVSDAQWEKEYQRALDQFNAQMALQRDQFDWQRSQATAGSGGYDGYSGNPGYPTSDDTGDEDGLDWTTLMDNWRFRSQLEEQNQKKYNTGGGKATYSPTGLASVGLGKYATTLTK